MADDLATPTGAELEFDPNDLRAKYQAERDKRLRSEGEAQYIELDGDFAHFAEDEEGTKRFDLDRNVGIAQVSLP